MVKRIGFFVAATLLAAGPAAAQDAQAVLQAAAETMGVTGMTSIRYSGSGWVGATGQNYSPDLDWPRFELAEYTRTIDFETNSSLEEMVVRQGGYPARGGGGAPIRGERVRTARHGFQSLMRAQRIVLCTSRPSSSVPAGGRSVRWVSVSSKKRCASVPLWPGSSLPTRW